jgi:hypothetical protein
LATALLLSGGGCLWEPVQETPTPGNADVAPVIESASPTNHEIGINNEIGALCELQAGLPDVFSPRGASLTARFYLNYGDTENAATFQPLALGGNGQIDWPLQVSPIPTLYSLPTQVIPLKDFLGLLDSPTNVLWVFVSDDFTQCPNPSEVVTTPTSSSSNIQTLECFTTSWSWVIDLTGCSFSAP